MPKMLFTEKIGEWTVTLQYDSDGSLEKITALHRESGEKREWERFTDSNLSVRTHKPNGNPAESKEEYNRCTQLKLKRTAKGTLPLVQALCGGTYISWYFSSTTKQEGAQ